MKDEVDIFLEFLRTDPVMRHAYGAERIGRLEDLARILESEKKVEVKEILKGDIFEI